MHKHKCYNCNVVWQHEENCANNLKAHQCPECGKEQWYKYKGDNIAEYTNVCRSYIQPLIKSLKHYL